jgi:hypothetical protein
MVTAGGLPESGCCVMDDCVNAAISLPANNIYQRLFKTAIS